MAACPQCGVELRPGMVRCRDCGHVLSGGTSVAVAEVKRPVAVAAKPGPEGTTGDRSSKAGLDRPSDASAKMVGLDRPSSAGVKDRPSTTGKRKVEKAGTDVSRSGQDTGVPSQPKRATDVVVEVPKEKESAPTVPGQFHGPLTESPSDAARRVLAARMRRPAQVTEDSPSKAAPTPAPPTKQPAKGKKGESRIADASDKRSAGDEAEEPQTKTAVKKLSWLQLRGLRSTLATHGLEKPKLAEQRKAALISAGESGDTQVVPLAVQALGDEWIVVREAAAVALGKLRDPEAVPPLIEVMGKDSSADIRKAAGMALAAIGDARAVMPLLKLGLEQPQQKPWIPDALARIGKGATGALVKALGQTDPGLRLDAIVALGRIRDVAAVKPLTAMLRDPLPIIQAHAAEALGSIGEISAAPAVVELLNHPDPGVRANSAAALVKMPHECALAPLLKTLVDEDSAIRSHAAAALGSIGDAEALEPLSRLLADADEQVRLRAVEALGSISDTRAVPFLIQAIDDKVPAVREKAALGLGKHGDPAGIDALIKALDDTYQNVRRQTAEALGQIGDPRATPALSKFMSVERLVETRLAAARSLGQIGDPRALTALQESLNEEFSIRCRACVAIGAIGTPQAVDILIPLLRDPVPEMRYHASVALGNIGDTRAMRYLEELMADSDPFVLRGVAKALQLFGDARAKDVLERASRAVSPAAVAKKESSPPRYSARSTKARRRPLTEVFRDFSIRMIPNVFAGWIPRIDISPKLIAAAVLLISVGVVLSFQLGLFGNVGLGSGNMNLIQRGKIQHVAFGANSLIAVATSGGGLELWNVTDGSMSGAPLPPERGARLVASDDKGQKLAVAVAENKILLLSPSSSGEPKTLEGHPAAVQTLRFSGDGATLYSADRTGTVISWKSADGSQIAQTKTGIQGSQSVAICPVTQRVAIGMANGTVKIWDLTKKAEFASIPAHTRAVSGLAFNRDGTLLATAGADGSIHVWDLVGRKLERTLESKVPVVPCLAFNADSKFLATGGGPGVVIWDLAAEKELRRLNAAIESVTTLSFSADGRLLAGGSSEGYDVAVWNLETGKLDKLLSPSK